MRKAKQFSRRVNNWDVISANAKPHLPDMPFLQPILAELDGVIVAAKGLDSDQEVARQQLADLTHRRQALERHGEGLRARISAHLKGNFGYTSDQLIQFGIRPIHRRKKVKPVPVSPEASAASQTSIQ